MKTYYKILLIKEGKKDDNPYIELKPLSEGGYGYTKYSISDFNNKKEALEYAKEHIKYQEFTIIKSYLFND